MKITTSRSVKLPIANQWLRVAILLGWSLLQAESALSATSWTNPTLGNWNISGNWNSGVPSSTTDVFITNSGTALINSNSPAAAANYMVIGGDMGQGSLIVNNGAHFLQSINLGGNVSTRLNGRATVSGTGSLWSMPDFLLLNGLGILNIESGATIQGSIGFVEGFSVATVTGTGSSWSNSELYVGESGEPTGGSALRIGAGGLVQAGSLGVYQNGSVEVNNGQSTVAGLIVSGGIPVSGGPFGGLTVANTGNGRMVVQTGGKIANSFSTIGAGSGVIGSVLVDGAGSRWTNTDQVVAGLNGNGTLEVRSGGRLDSVRGFAGANVGSSGSITVSDPGSTWNASGSFFIGNSGAGALAVLNGGGASTTGNGHLGFMAGASGDVNVSGAGSTLNIGVLLNIGGDSGGARGAAAVRIADGGAVNVGSATNLYNTGRLDLVNATTFTGELNAFGGFLRTFGSTTLANAVHLNAGGLIVETNNFGSAVFSGALDGPGGITKNTSLFGVNGRGTLTLTADNTYTGATMVNGGTLVVDGSITSATTVNVGATLSGSGVIIANVTNSGIVAPGNSLGTLYVTGNYAQHAGGALRIELASVASSDKLAVTGAMTLSGTLDVSLFGDFELVGGESFDILDWITAPSGTFSSIQLPTLGETLEWDTSELYVTGVLSVSGPASPAGDFNQDGDVDGRDFLLWQQGGSPNPLSAGDLADWQVNYGAGPLIASVAVPESATWSLLLFATLGRFRRWPIL